VPSLCRPARMRGPGGHSARRRRRNLVPSLTAALPQHASQPPARADRDLDRARAAASHTARIAVRRALPQCPDLRACCRHGRSCTCGGSPRPRRSLRARPLVLVALVPRCAQRAVRVHAQTSIHFHYTPANPPLVIARSSRGAPLPCRLLGRPRSEPRAGGALAGNYYLGAIPLWRWLPGGSSSRRVLHGHGRMTAHRGGPRAIPATPPSRTNTPRRHLSARRRISASHCSGRRLVRSTRPGSRIWTAIGTSSRRARRTAAARPVGQLVRATTACSCQAYQPGSPAAAAAVPSSRAETVVTPRGSVVAGGGGASSRLRGAVVAAARSPWSAAA